MHHLDTLLIVGDKFQQETFISQLSSHVSLNNTTKLDAKTPLSLLNQTLEYSRQDRSISLFLPASFYTKLFVMYGVTKANLKANLMISLVKREALGLGKIQALQICSWSASLGYFN